MGLLSNYEIPNACLDEVVDEKGQLKPPYNLLSYLFSELDMERYQRLDAEVRLSFLNQGITYQVYNENQTTEHIFPFDLIPRIIPKEDWDMLEKGLIQRNHALNLFLKDAYSHGKIFKDKVVPEEMIKSSVHYCPYMENFSPPADIYCHISGTDLIRHNDSRYYVLEDNLRSPSGVSYVLNNREALKKVVGNIFKNLSVCPVSDYGAELLLMLQSVAPKHVSDPECVLLTPGMLNSAYFEHAFLAHQMGIDLVEGRDLVSENNYVYKKTTRGLKRVDVIYRRIDDSFLDPAVFRPDSLLGVKGLMAAYLAGNITIVNAPGTGIADDKSIYHYVPRIINYYLGEEAIIPNVHTYICNDPTDLAYVLEHLPELVIKPVDQSGGYGISIGNRLTKEQLQEVKKQILEDPRQYVAQPIMQLTTHATFIDTEGVFEPRHVDLRTFTLMGGSKNFVLQGGLTRVALRKGSLIVNSSQGGGSKDTWVLWR